MDTQQSWPQGVFPARLIEQLRDLGAIRTARPFDADQVQPASLDLRLGDVAFRVRSSFLPGPSHSVAERIYSPAMTRNVPALSGSSTTGMSPLSSVW